MYDHVFPPCFQEIPALPSSDPFSALFILTLSFYLVSLLIGFPLLCFFFFSYHASTSTLAVFIPIISNWVLPFRSSQFSPLVHTFHSFHRSCPWRLGICNVISLYSGFFSISSLLTNGLIALSFYVLVYMRIYTQFDRPESERDTKE